VIAWPQLGQGHPGLLRYIYGPWRKRFLKSMPFSAKIILIGAGGPVARLCRDRGFSRNEHAANHIKRLEDGVE
jgi:hypothetical protein